MRRTSEPARRHAARRSVVGGWGDLGARTPRWSTVTSTTLRIRDTPVHVLRAGAGDGIPQLLVHGLGGSATNWLDVIPALAVHGPVVAPDLPGFGHTPPPHRRAPRISANVHFLRALLDALQWRRCVVHGNSMGGALAVLLAALDDVRIERLVLAAPALPGHRGQVTRIDPETLRRFGPLAVPVVGSAMARRAFRGVDVDELWERNIAYIHADPSRVSPELTRVSREGLRELVTVGWRLPSLVEAAASVVGGVLGRRRLLHAMAQVDASCLVVWGDSDRLISRAVIDTIAARRPDWSIEILGGVGHVPMMEVPGEYVRCVRGWMDLPDDGMPPDDASP